MLAVGARADSHTLTDYSLPVPEGIFFCLRLDAQLLAYLRTTPSGPCGITADRGAVRSFEGTSFAAPVVSGTAALLKQRYPDATAAQIRDIIAAAAEPSGGFVDPLRTLTFLSATHVLPQAEPLTLTPEVKTHSLAPSRAAVLLSVLAVVGLLAAAVASVVATRRR